MVPCPRMIHHIWVQENFSSPGSWLISLQAFRTRKTRFTRSGFSEFTHWWDRRASRWLIEIASSDRTE